MPNEDFQADLRRARAGDRDALERLLARQHERLERMARRKLGTGLKARVRTSDILQSTFLDVIRSVPDFEGESEEAFGGWVARILENNIRDKGKYFAAQKRREPTTPLDVEEDAPGLPAPTPTPSACAAGAEDLLLVSRALEALPEDYRRIIILRQIDGRSHKEAAEILGRTEAATRMLLSRARASLAIEIDRLRGGAGDEG